MENKTDMVIPTEVYQQVVTKLGELEELLKPYFIEVSTLERKRMTNISDGSYPFVEKAIQYSETNKEFVPNFLDVEAIKRDFDLYKQTQPLLKRITQLHTNIENISMESGHEAYSQVLSFYNSIKYAYKMGVNGAKDIYEDLRVRFRN